MKIKIKDHLAIELEKEKKTNSESLGGCKVCDDKATGIHYGVESCQSCKVITLFFYFSLNFDIN